MVAELTVINNHEGTHGAESFSPSGCNPNARCGNGLEKIYPTCAVRYGSMRHIGEFRYSPGMLFNCGAKVVIQSNRGIELGEQVSLTCTGCDKSIDRRQMQKYAKNSGPDFLQLKTGRILRVANAQDLDEERHLAQDAEKKLVEARDLAREMSLPMKFVTCEHLLGGERIIFHFMAEGRVDFRNLVKKLAQEYHTRIEMHQVGARDEARLVADYEICGRECCCKSFLKKLRQVNMKMAKLQKATLDPSKVSGRCGRLRCCLRYEHEGYEDLNRALPKIGVRVRTESGIGTIRDRQILTQLLIVEYDESGVREPVAIEGVLERNLPPRQAPTPKHSDRADSRKEKESRSDAKRPRNRGRSARDRDQTPQSKTAPPNPPGEQAESPAQKEKADNQESSGVEAQPGSSPAGEGRKRRRRRRGRGNRNRRSDGNDTTGSTDPGPTDSGTNPSK
ncbi:MAG: stage 0 sporulation family protein [Phycisphaerae bacterium]